MALGTARKRPPSPSERDIWIAQMRETQTNLENARARFNQATQPELIEQCVFEINALQARLAYFWRVIRQTEEEGGEGA